MEHKRNMMTMSRKITGPDGERPKYDFVTCYVGFDFSPGVPQSPLAAAIAVVPEGEDATVKVVCTHRTHYFRVENGKGWEVWRE